GGVDEELRADQLHELAEVDLRDKDLLEAAHDLARVARERVQVAEVRVRDLLAVRADTAHAGGDRSVRAAPGEDERLRAVWIVDVEARAVPPASGPLLGAAPRR